MTYLERRHPTKWRRRETQEHTGPQGGALRICPSCGKRIRGYYHVPGVLSFSNTYEPPRFCDACDGPTNPTNVPSGRLRMISARCPSSRTSSGGTPFPWLDRKGRIYELENMLDEQGLDPADELMVREQFEALRNPDLDEVEAKRRWERAKSMAPGLWEQGKPILDSVVSAAIKSQMGL